MRASLLCFPWFPTTGTPLEPIVGHVAMTPTLLGWFCKCVHNPQFTFCILKEQLRLDLTNGVYVLLTRGEKVCVEPECVYCFCQESDSVLLLQILTVNTFMNFPFGILNCRFGMLLETSSAALKTRHSFQIIFFLTVFVKTVLWKCSYILFPIFFSFIT